MLLPETKDKNLNVFFYHFNTKIISQIFSNEIKMQKKDLMNESSFWKMIANEYFVLNYFLVGKRCLVYTVGYVRLESQG